ncbi:hypothetical protein KKD52_12725 [Myxococcota bacterium]|nr:hypothetical protein [Myxococcota bacterium]MBU1410635.1 hypothetical protein [Myxococcota bacterium]MBU1511216.1 hypothetical protein [Myxococcota bacterium]
MYPKTVKYFLIILSLFSAVACTPDKKKTSAPPVIVSGPATREVYVGTELTVQVVATDVDSPELTFSFRAPTIQDLQTRPNPPTMTQSGAQSAYFRFTPTSADVGDHFIDLVVTDGVNEVSGVLTVRVQSSTGSNPYPVFVAPLGSGTTLDLEQDTCFSIQVQVEDADSSAVDITIEEPVVEGYELTAAAGSFTGSFSWCPTQKQIDESDRFSLNLKADDREGHVTFKRYTLLLRRPVETDCPGAEPVVSHTPVAALDSVNDVVVSFTVTDDAGIFAAPIVYYSTNVSNPDTYYIGDLIPVTSQMVSGSRTNGQYTAVIPNPVVSLTPGASRTVSYVIEAQDDDDLAGKCDHRVLSPLTGMYQTTVTHPTGTVTGGALCTACTADVQCGGVNDACVVLAGGTMRCLVDCQDDPEGCPNGTVCSVDPLVGVTGLTRRQCVPLTGSCVTGGCVADSREDDDAPSTSLPALADGTYSDLTMCMDTDTGMVDPDWFRFTLSSTTLTLIELQFLHAQGDIDMKLRDAANAVVDRSMSVTNNETIVACLEPATYYIEVFSWDEDVSTSYDLVFETIPGGCCQDDAWEPSDMENAIPVMSNDIVDELSICSGDEDWFAIDLVQGQYLYVEVLFDQTTDEQDLDVYVVSPNGSTILTPCCDPDNGQSATSNEELLFEATSTATYYVLVEGFYGSENSYMISFEVMN